MEGPGAQESMEGCLCRDRGCRNAAPADAHLARRPGSEGDRRLPVPERPNARRIGQGEASRPGLDPWRRFHHGGCEFQRWHLVRQAGNRVRKPELSDRCPRFSLLAGTLRRKCARDFGQLRPSGHDRGPEVGEGERCGLRRRSVQGDHHGRERRRHRRVDALRVSAREGPLPGRHLRERRFLLPGGRGSRGQQRHP